MKKLKAYWLNYCNVGDILTLKIAQSYKQGLWYDYDESDWVIKEINEFEIRCLKVGFKLEGFKITQDDINNDFVRIMNNKTTEIK